MSGLFITATDTAVGKTFVTLLLAQKLIENGFDVGVFKPISCGPKKDNDAVYLKKELGLKDPFNLINPIQLKLPLAPYVAAKSLKKKIDRKKIFRAYKKLSKLHEIVLVEGVGGALVPIAGDYYVADLIKELDIPTIIVARAGLGTINHTLQTVETLRALRIPIMGIIMNGYKGKELSEETNDEAISKLSKLSILAKIPWQKI
ncbi:dethiobiotin synthase [candidate division WOR-1 bacterium RIFCSPLOWO2_02_FULL_46_20]|uniref:ATP-dependent dethiobiotin synthetase BioD n=2 Tax=Saganbacteria TaxID=1703751 RepID=A0A1F4RG28_UNCSA|nr:MAG: dethiobiotin synthase [candidate division WOR-1 bacterium RIFCSPHIGHO2_02_FULL_45_12]OGC07108.1 MAG: dethiobiotin synthase [candidate division WOR-1 bacterium RIFCSPLOWO2_02_FULL_46_20]OGC07977.1 MAG: dethiobiotin synthase [candidate division WOR-1 bacterium RIFCSPLOWO2_12_FULL_45_9]